MGGNQEEWKRGRGRGGKRGKGEGVCEFINPQHACARGLQ